MTTPLDRPRDDRPSTDETAVRTRLGIPDSAHEVVVVAESTHWDPDWLLRSEQYHRRMVRPTLDRVLDLLEAEPRRVFSIECVFFVDLWWRDRPEQRARFRRLVEQGRIHFSGTGITTPDTLLPDDELILRDLRAGRQWLVERGMQPTTRSLYLPDSFGHSPGLPGLLHAAGLERAVVCRIDGMRFPGADLEAAARFPRPESSAAALLDAGTADFIWRGPDGNEVLAHWVAFSYGHGDLLASGGISRTMGLPLAWADRRAATVDRRADRYLTQLRSVARTPYRLLAVGTDFAPPIPHLVDILDRWNDRNHGRTGTWMVNATIDDYLDLVTPHRALLPTIEFDPNPYWMGFTSSRPSIKARSRELGRRLLAQEAATLLRDQGPSHPQSDRTDPVAEGAHPADTLGATPLGARLAGEAPDPWWVALTANHHDFITGTSPDRVALREQEVWLTDALARTPWPGAPPVPTGTSAPVSAATPTPAPAPATTLTATRHGRLLTVRAPWGTCTFDPACGGALTSVVDASGLELLAGPSLVLSSYLDSGGLWRLGNEFPGGQWTRLDTTARHHATVEVEVSPDATQATVIVRGRCDGLAVELRHDLRADDPIITTSTRVPGRRRRTVTLAVHPQGHPTGVTMHQPGGVVARPLQRWYEPTFWPLHSFAATDVGSLTCAVATPSALHVAQDGTAEVIVARNPFKEIAYRVIPVMAPAWGWSVTEQRAAVAWRFDSAVPAARPLDDVVRRGRAAWRRAERALGWPVPAWPVETDCDEVEVLSVASATSRPGVLVRLRDWGTAEAPARCVLRTDERLGPITAAHLVDIHERDLGTDLRPGGPSQGPTRVLDACSVSVARGGHLRTVLLERDPPENPSAGS